MTPCMVQTGTNGLFEMPLFPYMLSSCRSGPDFGGKYEKCFTRPDFGQKDMDEAGLVPGVNVDRLHNAHRNADCG